MRQLLCIGFLAFVCTFTQAQNVGVNMPTPTENLHVDSIIKVGKNAPLNQQARKNLLKFGDGSYVSIGEEVADDKLYIRYGDLSFMKSSGSVGSGFIGINTETPSAYLDVAGTFRLRGNGAAAGKVLVSDADGNATWQTQSFTLPFSGSTDGGMIALNISNTGSSFTTFTGIKG
ncbi:MAG TPA: hypothetical protein VMR70_06760, partial [Flavisolibacter sp.]|nr:hypothetical protein [Flavisolibacter sp.]